MLDDIDYFLKKMNWSEKDLEEYLSRPEIKHESYLSEVRLWNLAKKIHGLLYKKV